jgi:hypothetical protein
MRSLGVVFRSLRKFWRRWSEPSPDSDSISLFDPNEFSKLLRSGRKEDLKTLAKRLSERQKTKV